MTALLVLVHWLHLLALALWIGGLAGLTIVLRAGRRVHPEDVALLESARRRTRAILWWAIIALMITLAAEIGLRTLATSAHAGTAFTTSLRTLLFGTRSGQASVAQWLVLVASLWALDELGRAPVAATAGLTRWRGHALGIVAAPPRRPHLAMSPRAWLRSALLLAAALLVCTAVAGPYGGAPLPAIVDALHLGATMLWLGGTIVIALAVLPFVPLVGYARQPIALLALLDRFTPAALVGVVVLVLTGLWESAHAPPAPGSSVSTLAGPTPALMALVLAIMVATSAWGLMVLRPRMRRLAIRARRDARAALQAAAALATERRLLWVNAVLAVLAFLLGALADASPNHVSGAASVHRSMTLSTKAGPVTLQVRPQAAGPNIFDVYVSRRGMAIRGAEVVIRAHSLQMSGIDPLPIVAAERGGGHYRGRGLLTMGGRWRLHVSVRRGATVAAANTTVTAAPLRAPTSSTGAGTPAPGSWQPLGPSVITYAFVADPRNQARLYTGTAAGVYRSSDGGAHWTDASTGLSGSARVVHSLAVIADGSLFAATGAGVYRSTDGGGHWLAAGLRTQAIYSLATHMDGHVALLAGGDGGIFRSDDLGAHWHHIYNTGAAAVTSLAWPSVRPTLVVAGIVPSAHPVAVSDDGGTTWRTATQGLPALPGMMSVAVAPGAHDAYAGSMGRGAFTLPGLSGSWQERNDGLPGLATGDAHIGSFAFNPADPHILYAATDFGVYTSSDAGRHWARFGHGLRGDALVVTTLAFVNGPHPMLYAATAAGLYRTATR
jgi:photosystem II stability/assembly factor-like uncharacterized protein/uncharacterized membrane protein